MGSKMKTGPVDEVGFKLKQQSETPEITLPELSLAICFMVTAYPLNNKSAS